MLWPYNVAHNEHVQTTVVHCASGMCEHARLAHKRDGSRIIARNIARDTPKHAFFGIEGAQPWCAQHTLPEYNTLK